MNFAEEIQLYIPTWIWIQSAFISDWISDYRSKLDWSDPAVKRLFEMYQDETRAAAEYKFQSNCISFQ